MTTNLGDRLLLRPAEAAAALAVSRAKVYALIASNKLPHVLIGESIRVPVAQLQALIDAQLCKGADHV